MVPFTGIFKNVGLIETKMGGGVMVNCAERDIAL
jgi:hypothetical protein